MVYEKWRNPPYKPGQKTAYKISRSKIDVFVQCPRCFWLDGRLKISRPSIPAFTLNSAVDHLLKLEFDAIRETGEQHPLQQEYGIDAKPIKHDKLNVWRENYKGVEALHQPTNLRVTGAIDDLWQDSTGKYIVVDYKSTSRNTKIEKLDDSRWNDQYRRQLEIYQWLLRANGLPVSDTGYFVYCNAIKSRQGFDAKLEFEITLVAHTGKDGWIETRLGEIKNCLEGDIPREAADCEHCAYAKSRTVLTLNALQKKN
ncbi:PD-(D/E)XK nuclease family protein [Candidatus Saccharibacteria bacterium]|nr:PD-(D/E)XK nuclease family protein [Candidatus Saccharibacteria bacterium]